MTSVAHSHDALDKLDLELSSTAAPRRAHQAQFDAFPPAWRQRILALEAVQLDLRARRALDSDWSDKAFTAGSTMPSSTWNMLRSGKHPVPTTPRGIESIVAKLESLNAAVSEVRLRIASAEIRATASQALPGFVADVNAEAVIAALAKAAQRAAESSEERLIVIRAATGGGKTWLRRWLQQQGHVHYTVSARPAWKSSYTAFLRAVAAVLRLDVACLRGVAAIEAEIIEKASTLAGAVWFEEIQRLSVQAQEFIKLLLNETHLAVIISLTPEAYLTMRQSGGADFAQLFRRACCNMELSPPDDEYLKALAPDLFVDRSVEQGCTSRLLAEASRFGGRALITDVCARLRARLVRGGAISLALVEGCLSAYRDNVPDITATRRAFGQPQARRAA